MGHTRYDAIEQYLNEVCPSETMKKYEEERKMILTNFSDDSFNKLKELKNKYNIIFLDDVLYKEEQYKLFDEWFNNMISPFTLLDHKTDNLYSIALTQENFIYDWVKEEKTKAKYGDGHCYNDLFKDYLEENFKSLNNKLNYDSENGMFCVYCNDSKDADLVSLELSKLYKDENKMISLIKQTKEKYNYCFSFDFNFDIDIKI